MRKSVKKLIFVAAGATQVGFNRVSGNLLATAHDGDLRIWDQRMGSCPIQYITAHLARIHGINWSHRHESSLTTSSQDGTVKYFDINNPRRAERIITNASPVWRARYTPFADGLVTVIVPHLGRGENSLLLWNNGTQSAPICSFVGHTDVVLDFAWRPNRQTASGDMELITWSRDQTVRVWNVDEALQKLCESPEAPIDETIAGGDADGEFLPSADEADVEIAAARPTETAAVAMLLAESRTTSSMDGSAPIAIASAGRMTMQHDDTAKMLAKSLPVGLSSERSGSRHRTTTITTSTISSSITTTVSHFPSCSLQHEFSLLNTNIPHIDVEVLDPVKRTATVRCSVHGHTVMLQAVFPPAYPSAGHPPTFTYCQGTALPAYPPALCGALLKAIRTVAAQRTRKGRTCLEHCLRALVMALKKATGGGSGGGAGGSGVSGGSGGSACATGNGTGMSEKSGCGLRLQSPRLEGALSGALHDACVPFPRTSGARFGAGGAGMLVVFAQPQHAKMQHIKQHKDQQQQHHHNNHHHQQQSHHHSGHHHHTHTIRPCSHSTRS